MAWFVVATREWMCLVLSSSLVHIKLDHERCSVCHCGSHSHWPEGVGGQEQLRELSRRQAQKRRSVPQQVCAIPKGISFWFWVAFQSTGSDTTESWSRVPRLLRTQRFSVRPKFDFLVFRSSDFGGEPYEILDLEIDRGCWDGSNEFLAGRTADGTIPLFAYHEIPSFLQGNPYIIKGYRVLLPFSVCFQR